MSTARHGARGRTPAVADTEPRKTYRHGDLRRALLDAGVALVREGGPAALVLREATRRAGVVPNAAYRHFANHAALLDAVRGAALGMMARAMEADIAAAVAGVDGRVERARATLRAVGTGYLRFALAEPGLFRTAFVSQAFDVATGSRYDFQGDSGRDPFQLLCAALDDLVVAGALPAAQRTGAEYMAWSAVHGLAMLALDGPLRALPAAHTETLARRAVAMVERGLLA